MTNLSLMQYAGPDSWLENHVYTGNEDRRRRFFLPITRQNGRKQQKKKDSSELAFENWLMPQKCPKKGLMASL